MSPTRISLADHPLFSNFGPTETEQATELFERLDMDAGDILWRAGDEGSELGVIISGGLDVLVEGVMVGRVEPGQLVGEGSAFIDGAVHKTTVTCREPSTLLCAGRDDLHELRTRAPSVYGAFLQRAVGTAAQRVRTVDAAVTDLARSDAPRPRRTREQWLKRAWRQWFDNDVQGVPRPLWELARRLPVLAGYPPDVVARVLDGFSAVALTEGEPLFLEGDHGDTAYLLAEGKVEVTRRTDDERAKRLAIVGPGALIGAASLVHRGRRSASCVPVERGWAYQIQVQRWALLPAQVRHALYELVLWALSEQVGTADALLANLPGAKDKA